jgi:serine protease Do
MPVEQRLKHSGCRKPLRAAALGAAALLLLTAPALADVPSGNGRQNDITSRVRNEAAVDLPSLHPLVQRVLPAVVNISSEISEQAAASDQSSEESDQGDANSPFDQFLRHFFQNRGLPQLHQQIMALGSGFILDPSGYVVTNNHVVNGAHRITVILQDGSRQPAKVIGRDPKTDLALLKIDAGYKLPFVSWGDSSKAEVGDWVVAVGNAFGLGGTVTAGIISALGRDINEGPYDDFLQIDAPINRGNSGGPTFNLHGQVIGINTAIYSPSGGSVGIGFAIPSDTAKNVIEQLKTTGHVVRGFIGVEIQGVTPEIARSLGLNPEKPEGALVASVNPNGPAAKADIKQGDVIVEANGHPIKSVHDLPIIVAAIPPGQKLDLTVIRDGKPQRLVASVGTMPTPPQVAAAEGPATVNTVGLELSSIDAALRAHFGIPKGVSGVVVTAVAGDSPAAALGIKPGDVIQSIDQQPASSPKAAAKELQEASAKGNILLLVNRKGMSQFVGLSVSPGPGGSSSG